MKKINIFVNNFPKTSETFIYNKVKSLLENGFDVNLIVSQLENDAKGFYKDLNHHKNFKLRVAYINKAKNIKTIVNTLFSLNFYKIFFKNNLSLKQSYKEYLSLKTLNLSNPDIIHFEFSGIGFQYLPYLKQLKNIKIGSSFRGTPEKIKPLIDEKRRADFPIFLKHLDYCHCVSNNMAKELNQFNVNKEKVFINYPSINVNLFSYKDDFTFDTKTEINIISVGRLHWIKGIDIALLALQKLKENGYKFKYHLIGDGPEFEKLKFMTHNLNLTDEVVFLGFQPANKVSEYLKNAQLFLLPSYSEGLSNSALEAMCTGLPILSAKAGGMEEAITHQKNGFLFEIGDINELYLNLKSIFENKYDLNKIRLNASETVINKFNLKKQSNKFKELYFSL